MTEIISGAASALVLILVSKLKQRYFSEKIFATAILIAIAFIYVGFSLVDDRVEFIVLECGLALLLSFTAIVGYNRNSLWIAGGIIFHGIWDILHHNGYFIKTGVPAYWPSYCCVIDIIAGTYFLIAFKKAKENTPGQAMNRIMHIKNK